MLYFDWWPIYLFTNVVNVHFSPYLGEFGMLFNDPMEPTVLTDNFSNNMLMAYN